MRINIFRMFLVGLFISISLNGFALNSEVNSMVKAGTGAKAEVLAGEILNAKVSFGGSIFYKGNPKVVKDKKVIGGIIQKRD